MKMWVNGFCLNLAKAKAAKSKSVSTPIEFLSFKNATCCNAFQPKLETKLVVFPAFYDILFN
jgi:hypothetical protein